MTRLILRLALLAVPLFSLIALHAQYSNPTVVSSGIWISRAEMNVPGVTGGVNGNSAGPPGGSQGYTNQSASSSGTINRGCSVSFNVTIQNCSGSNRIYNFRLYADWNNDFDFNDPGETLANLNGSITAGSCTSLILPLPFTTPTTANSGAIRFRWTLREGVGDATPDGGYIGEIEDYSLNVNANTAPVLNNSGTPFINPVIVAQTTNPGTLVSRLIQSTEPGMVMITDAGPCDGQGIAITGTASAIGAWQYQVGTGAWTAVGARAESNALILGGAARLRFVPTAQGTASFTFRAWDGTSGSSGGSVNIVSPGGASACSSASETASIQVSATATADNDIAAYMTAQENSSAPTNLISSLLGSPAKQFEQITTDSSGRGRDIALDQLNNNLYWIGGPDNASFMRAATTGAGVTVLGAAESFFQPSGLALADNSVFIIDNDGIEVRDLNGAFTNAFSLPGTGFGATGDIEFAGGKLYFILQDDFAGAYSLYSMNTDGTGATSMYAFPDIPAGLDIANGIIYWTEQNGTTSFIRSMPVAGGAVTTLATGANRKWLDLIVNTANSRIYFADMNLANGDAYLKSIPRTGGTELKELILDYAVSSLAIDRDPATLPVRFISVTAKVQDTRNIVDWVIAQEENVDHYEVERSSDGRTYSVIGSVDANSQQRYQFADEAPLSGVNIYRIRAVDIDAKVLYSPIVRLVRDDQSKGVAVYPTLITNNQFTLRLQNLRAGSYQLQVISNAGQPVLTQRIAHTNGVTANTISLPSTLSKGVYRVVLISDEEKFTTNIVVQ